MDRAKKNPAPVQAGTGVKNDYAWQHIDFESKLFHHEIQLPTAIAKPLGFCSAVYVRHATGQEERRPGFFTEPSDARRAASALNALFKLEGALS